MAKPQKLPPKRAKKRIHRSPVRSTVPVDPTDTDTIELVLAQVDTAVQYHDDVEPRTGDGDEDALDGSLGDGGQRYPEWAQEVVGSAHRADGGDAADT